MAAAAVLEKFQMAISPQPVIRSTSCLVLGWVFRGRRIECRYFRFDQIQDGGRRHLGNISNGHWLYLCNRSSDPLHVWFYGGVFGTADRMVLFPVRTNLRWRPPPSLKNFKWPAQRVVRFSSCFALKFTLFMLLSVVYREYT